MADRESVSPLRALARPIVRGGLQALQRSVAEARAVAAGLRFGLVARLATRLGLRPPDPLLRQRVRRFVTSLPGVDGYTELRRVLEERGVRCCEGSWTLYLPPQDGLRGVLGEIVMQYPADAAFKILKDLRPAESARYIPADRRDWAHKPVSTWMDTLLVGDSHDQLLRATVLFLYGIGPRAYDVVTLCAGGVEFTAFVVQHVGGGTPTADQHAGLIERIERRLKSGELGLPMPDWKHSPDFSLPDCNGNAICDARTGDVLYVDSQNFLVRERKTLVRGALDAEARRDLHFGDERTLRGGRYLYQSVPEVLEGGKRDTGRRWEVISGLLERAGVGLTDVPVFDIGCNAGMMLAYALSSGASWGVGWDRPPVIRHARDLLLTLGFTRVDLFGAELRPDYPLLRDMPKHLQTEDRRGVVFHLAMRKHIGFLEQLPDLPWRAMVYEGNEEESLATLETWLSGLRKLCRFTIAEAIDYSDGECAPRPLAILIRQD
jgi:hypothetical protein